MTRRFVDEKKGPYPQMKRPNLIKRLNGSGFYSALLATTIAVPASGSFAQTQNSAIKSSDQTASPKKEKISITGSRIKRIDLETDQSVQVFDRDAIDNSGVATVADFLRNNMPGGDLSTENRTLSQVAGSSSFSGRDQGANYTLVLVNGRRLPTNAIADDFVDLNMIPMAAVERIEYLTDGASAIYGSDAVAGVVNIITRKSFDGTSVRTRIGQASRGDGTQTSYQLVTGGATSRGNYMITYDYFKQEPVAAVNRPLIKSSIAPDGSDGRSPNGLPGSILRADGTWEPFVDCPADARGEPVTDKCGYDFGRLYQVIPKSERHALYTVFDQDITDSINLFGELRYARAYTYSANGAAPGAVEVSKDAPANPYNEDILLIRRYVDWGARRKDNTNESFSVVAGLKGPVTYDIDWEFVVTSHKLRNLQVGAGGQINGEKASQYFNDGTLNPFIYNTFDTAEQRAAKEDIDTEFFREGTSKLQTYALSLAGLVPSLPLPGGPIGFALALEYRDETFLDRSDTTLADDLILGSAGGNAGGSRDNQAAAAELNLPLHKKVDLRLASRHDIINDDASATTYNIGLAVRPTNRVLFRASRSTGFKAPALHELYLASSFGVQEARDTKLCADTGECDKFEIQTRTVGNEKLKPENSVYTNVGTVLELTDSLTLSMDYWTLEIQDKIAAMSLQQILNQEDRFQDLITRVNNRLTEKDSGVVIPLENLNREESTGFDTKIRYNARVGGGRLAANLVANKLLSSKSQLASDEPLCEYADRRKGMDFKGSLSFDKDGLGLNSAFRYNAGYTTYDGDMTPGTCTPDAPESKYEVSSNLQVDLGASYQLIDSTKVGVGVQNAFDEEPSFDRNGRSFEDGGSSRWPWYDQSRYSNMGRFYYLTLTHDML